MRKPISTQTHGVLDYLTAATLATLPSMLGFSERTTRAIQMMAIGKLCYSLLTDNELGVVRAIPMKAHLAMDAVSGVALAALPFMLDEDDDTATAVCIGAGLMELSNAAMTQTEPSDRNYPRQAARSTARMARSAARRTREMVGAGSSDDRR
jgi:hypothetical protein